MGHDSNWATITHNLFCIQTIFSTFCIFHVVGSLNKTPIRSIRMKYLSTFSSQIIPFSFSYGISLRVHLLQISLNVFLPLLQVILTIKWVEIHSIAIVLYIVDGERALLLVNNTFHASIVTRFEQLSLLIIDKATRILRPRLRFGMRQSSVNLCQVRPYNVVVGGLVMRQNPRRRDICCCGRCFLNSGPLLLGRWLRKLRLRAGIIIVIQRTSIISIPPGVLRITFYVILQRFTLLALIGNMTRK